MRPAEVLEQQQSARNVRFVHVRHMGTQRLQQLRHFEVRAHVLFPGRRVHHDESGSVAERAEVAPEAGIAGSGLDPLRMQPQVARQPIL